MKFVISTQELNYLINKIQNIIPLKPTVPILTNFLIEASKEGLTLTATDLMVGIRCNTEVNILEEGSTTLPAKKLGQLVRELTAANVEISSNSNQITTVISGTSKFKLNGIGKNEYPALPDLSQGCQFNIKQKILKDLLYRTSFAVSKEDSRYILTGLCMQISNGVLTFIGTDGKKLSRAHVSIAIPSDVVNQSVIPLKAVDEIVKNLIEDEDEEATISLADEKIAMTTSQITIISKLLSGDYPDITRIIPEKSTFELSLHRNELISLLRQVSLFIPDQNHPVKFTFVNGEMSIAANSIDLGEGHVGMPVNYHGDTLEIALNPNYFLDILRHCKEETITLGLTDSYNPGIIRDGENVDHLSQSSPLYLIMPMRLSQD